MDNIVPHSNRELRRGLYSALAGTATPQLREVEAELRLAGFLIDIATVTPAGRRFIGIHDPGGESRLAAA